MHPEAAAWTTKTRLKQDRVIEAAHISTGLTVVRTLRIFSPGALPTTALAGTNRPHSGRPTINSYETTNSISVRGHLTC
ncbi:hypothetical protein HUV60_000055 [Streptomyces sp. KMM 9044]|nr:hypothetical protein [Streptomyces sp. KMM 9044]WAX76326.1 hypothetical protein HUV60_000055 [Streptomyces sp. KMM 9044]